MPETLSIRAYAARCGVDEKAIRQLVARGLPLTPAGKVDPATADAWRARFLSARRQNAARKGLARRAAADVEGAAKAPASSEPPAAPEPASSAAPSLPVTVSDVERILADPTGFLARVTLAEAERMLAGIKVLREAKAMEREALDWVRVADVVETLRDQLVTVRTRLLSIPGSLATRVAHSEPARVEKAMLDAIRDALEELSGEKVAAEAQAERAREEAKRARRRSGPGRAAGFSLPPGSGAT